MVDKSRISLSASNAAQFDEAFERLGDLVDFEAADQLFQQRPHTVYTASVVLWLLVCQRLRPDASLVDVVKHLHETRPNLLPDNKRLREGKFSDRSGSYSVARKRLPLDVVKWFADEVTEGIISASEPFFDDRRVFVIDGTTLALPPEKELQTAFPPAPNQHGDGVWPIALLTVFHELSSGSALLPEIGPMYGDHAVSESRLACNGFGRLPSDCIVMADAGFGIFGVAHETIRHGHDFLFRMKKANFESLRKKAELVSQSEHHKSYQHTWIPTSNNRRTHPELPEDASLSVSLHEVEVTDKLTLYLVTSLECDAWTLSELFERRYDVEVDIRNFKLVIGTEEIRAKSVDTFTKELYASVVAYNLTTQIRREAAKLNNVAPRKMSFKGVWSTFNIVLLRHMYHEPKEWRDAFIRALKMATGDKLPNRPGRKFKREAYRKRPKNCQFPQRKKPPSKL